MRISLPRRSRLFVGIMATIFSLGCGFSMTASAVSPLPQTGGDSGTETPPKPPSPFPRPPELGKY